MDEGVDELAGGRAGAGWLLESALDEPDGPSTSAGTCAGDIVSVSCGVRADTFEGVIPTVEAAAPIDVDGPKGHR
jgi:hypothetical protein